MNFLKKIVIIVGLVFAYMPSNVCASNTKVCTLSNVTSMGLRAAMVGIYALPLGIGVAFCQFIVERNLLRSVRAPFYNATEVKIVDDATGITYSVPVDVTTMQSHVVAYLQKNHDLRIAPQKEAYLYGVRDGYEPMIGEGYAIKGAMVDYLLDTFHLKTR